MFEGQTPFMSVNAGNLLSPVSIAPEMRTDIQLKVIRVERIFWEADAYIGDKVCVYCDAVTTNEY